MPDAVPASDEPAIVLSGVRKSFGATIAVEDLDLTVPRGAVYGLIGPNGAGKTTTIRMVLAILFPDRGEIAVLGRRSALEAKDRIGYLPEERGLYRRMRVRDFLRYMGNLKGIEGVELERRIGRWLERVDLADAARRRCEELSKGMQQKAQFVATVLHEPELLVLDEPFSGLDPLNMRLLRELIRGEHARGATIVFSTHVMVQAEELCDHIVMIDAGRKVLDEPLARIRARHAARALLFEPLDPAADLALVRALPGVVTLGGGGDGRYTVALAPEASPSAVMAAIAAAVPAARLEIHRPSLEDVFVDIVNAGTPADAAAGEARARRLGEAADRGRV